MITSSALGFLFIKAAHSILAICCRLGRVANSTVTMSRHVSKADEATSWRRTTALPREQQQKQGSGGGYLGGGAHHHRSQSAEPTVHAAGRQHHLGGMQPLEPHKAVPTAFCADEALQNLERRWLEVTSQGLQPTCQCSSTSKGEDDAATAAAAADGSSTAAGEGSSTAAGFLAALEAACKVNSADAAWDDD